MTVGLRFHFSSQCHILTDEEDDTLWELLEWSSQQLNEWNENSPPVDYYEDEWDTIFCDCHPVNSTGMGWSTFGQKILDELEDEGPGLILDEYGTAHPPTVAKAYQLVSDGRLDTDGFPWIRKYLTENVWKPVFVHII